MSACRRSRAFVGTALGTLLGMALATPLLSGCEDCDHVCAELDDFRRFPCAAPPNMLCDSKMQPAKPLNRAEISFLEEQCAGCNSCAPCSSVPTEK